MSRSGYSSDIDSWDLIKWRGAVVSAINGKRGQEFLVGLGKLMDEMPEKKLIAGELINAQGECCTLGLACKALGTDISDIDIEDGYLEECDREKLSKKLNIAYALICEVMFMNDDFSPEDPYGRWLRMREWIREETRIKNGEHPHSAQEE